MTAFDLYGYLLTLAAGELDRLLALRREPPEEDWFEKGTWRGDLHRREHARALRNARCAHAQLWAQR